MPAFPRWLDIKCVRSCCAHTKTEPLVQCRRLVIYCSHNCKKEHTEPTLSLASHGHGLHVLFMFSQVWLHRTWGLRGGDGWRNYWYLEKRCPLRAGWVGRGSAGKYVLKSYLFSSYLCLIINELMKTSSEHNPFCYWFLCIANSDVPSEFIILLS